MILPEKFSERMRKELGDEYEAFAASYDAPLNRGLRINTLKTDEAEIKRLTGFCLEPVPWTETGFYYGEEDRPGKSSLHEAGAFYMQEPSAMCVANLAAVTPGEKVLDLCAAPGGKTTQLGAALKGEGLLVSNEIHPGRCKILSQNVERMGITNCVVTNETPDSLEKVFHEFFDCVVVDAPCSGEGMFRKEEDALKMWSPENVTMCAERQREILDKAVRMVAPGGRLVYSTCTFAREEDEDNVDWILAGFPDFELVETRRMWPHKVKGEGHFAALLQRKAGDEARSDRANAGSDKITPERKKLLDKFLNESFTGEFIESIRSKTESTHRFVTFGDSLYLCPASVELKKLKVLRAGLKIGSWEKNRFEPDHALAMALKEEDCNSFITLKFDSPLPLAYQKGESIRTDGNDGILKEDGPKGAPDGWTLVTIEGISAGWGKTSAGVCKNHYPKGLRINA